MLRRSASIPKNIGYTPYGKKEFKVGCYYDSNKNTVVATSVGITDDIRSIANGNKSVAMLNNPILDAQVINSYQILIDKKYVTEVNNELITDLVTNSKIVKGVIKSPLIWCKIGSKLQLVRVGSSLHKEVISAESRKKLKKIRSKDFEIGGIYSTPAGKSAIYLGKVDAHVGQIEYQNVSEVKTHFVKNKKLFYYINASQESIDIDSINKWSLNLKESHSFVEKVGSIILDKDIISKIRDSFTKKFKEYIVSYSQQKMGNPNVYLNNTIYWEYRYVCPFISMVESGNPPMPKFDLNKYLILS